MKVLFDATKDLSIEGPRSGLRISVNTKSVKVDVVSLYEREGWGITFPAHLLPGINSENAAEMVDTLLQGIDKSEGTEFISFTGNPPYSWTYHPVSDKKVLI